MSDNNVHTFRPKKLTLDDIRDGCIYLTNGDEGETRICVVNEELRQGIDFLKQYPKSVTIFGSARTKPTEPHYLQTVSLAKRLAKLGYAIISGGGPGIMEAANRGAYEAEGDSIGMTIRLPFEQKTSPYVTDEIPFYYFFTRKVALSYSAEAYVGMPGGFGTLDEIFEMLTLIQTKKISRDVPVILYGTKFWGPLVDYIKNTLLDEFATISPEDIDLFTLTDDEDEIVRIIEAAPLRTDD